MIRLLHTADWHLGQKLQGWSREVEHARVLDRLVAIAAERQVDALILAGDVFDTINVPHETERLYYETLGRLRRALPHLTVVVTAGNHDPAGRIDAPGPIVSALGIHTIGTVARRDGAIDIDRHLIPLRSATGAGAAHVLAIPHLGPASLPPIGTGDEIPGSPVVRAVTAFYAEAVAAARARIGAAPLILTGHLTIAGGLESEGAERRILIGGEHAIPATLFPADVAYVALGHLHKPQGIGRETVRYSGSLMPLSATERGYDHGVTIVEIDATGTRIEHVPIERPVPFLRIPARGGLAPAAIEAELQSLGLDPALPITERPFLHLGIRLDGPAPTLKADLDRIASAFPVRLVGHGIERPEREADDAPAADLAIDLADRDPLDLFRLAFDKAHPGIAPDERHLAAFAAALDAVRDPERQGA